REAKPPAATPEPPRGGDAEPVRRTKPRSRGTAGDDVKTERSGDREDDDVPTRRRPEGGAGRDDSEVSHGTGTGTDDGEAPPATGAARQREDDAKSGGGEDGGRDAEQRSSGAADHDDEAAAEGKREPVAKALAVAGPDEGSDDEADRGDGQSADD
ncbi:MAG: hypothetical protein QOF49_1840, partial [Chloroflexota bacterium]|nr:hypothetical protein [Chloroflexota bacterium]